MPGGLGASTSSGDVDDPRACGAPAPSDDASCIGTTFAGESIPLDIYIMFDQSGSMCSCLDPEAAQICPNPDCTETRLDAVRRASAEFLRDPKSAGIGVGLGRFGSEPIGSASCEAESHSVPTVTIGALPDSADALVNALDAIEPIGETPTGAAIRGACSYARSWSEANPGRRVVLLLLTDGKPEAPASCQSGTCCPSLEDAVEATAGCREEAEVDTYVLGVGPFLDNLDRIADAGGTGRAYLAPGDDVAGEVLAALNRIRGDAAIPCELQLPSARGGATPDYERVNLLYQSSECDETLLFNVTGAAQCGDEDGWYYDDPAAPRSIVLCPRSCERVTGPGGQLSYSIGCETRIR